MSASTHLPADLAADPLVCIAADLAVIAWERMTAWRASLGADLDESVVDTKTSPNDLVTLADAQIEALVRGYLSAVRPGDVMVGEEGAEAIDPVEFFDRDLLRRLAAFDPVAGALAEVTAGDAEGRFEWHVDPIDGTVNFVRGIEHFAFSVGVLDTATDAWAVGLVASPGLGATWVAGRSRGAYRVEGRLFDRMPEPDLSTVGAPAAGVPAAGAPAADGAPGAATPATRLSGAPVGLSGRLLATGFAYRGDNRGRQLAKLPALMDGYDDIRRCGSAALDLCMVAEGRVTCYAERGLGIYDYAGGALIAEEAGAFVHRGGSGGPTAAADSAAELARLIDTI
ncbi:inositol monophosphatase family protein [Brevibacterium casei]|uniref:inositol-phosphate phosphatase n=1 Tax=Brevibacterium casei TaxID=33889 RepID=A0A7T2TJ25_9MICO|nr:inositol monophosphatase family protein [Brevibacterium casei]MCT1548912.1 inositol-phosphate phosphatase [Brevibacterium casei]MCT1561595.1 inositol-phosphate phosphatase [Brevibacterium casei]MCT2207478.1 inositol-phosphate phosphatase [Brevibacterium casei]QPS34779.1 inositol-phosphate phosphatase [Brevibacterium casei]